MKFCWVCLIISWARLGSGTHPTDPCLGGGLLGVPQPIMGSVRLGHTPNWLVCHHQSLISTIVKFHPPPAKEAKTLPGIPWWHVTKCPHSASEEKWMSCHNPDKKGGCPNTVIYSNVHLRSRLDVRFLDVSYRGWNVALVKYYRVKVSQ